VAVGTDLSAVIAGPSALQPTDSSLRPRSLCNAQAPRTMIGAASEAEIAHFAGTACRRCNIR